MLRLNRLASSVLLALPVLAAPALAQAEVKYKVTQIGVSADFNFNNGPWLNSRGDVAGALGSATSFLYSGGSVATVGASGESALFSGLNGNGAAVGTHYDSAGHRATVWNNGVATAVGANGSFGWGINDSGAVAGSVAAANGTNNAAVFSNGQQQVLSSANSSATAINTHGVVAGVMQVDQQGLYARDGFIYKDGVLTTFNAGPASLDVTVEAISDNGTVVGMAGTQTGHIYGYTYKDGVMSDIGSLYSLGNWSWTSSKAVNSLDQVVGFSAVDRRGTFHAFLYSDGAMVDLNSLIDPGLGLVLDSATGINDRGQILATTCSEATWMCGVVVLDPLSPVPEPATYGMLLGGLGVVGMLARRRRSVA